MITGAKILQRKIVAEIQTTNRQTANDHVIPDMTSHRQDLFVRIRAREDANPLQKTAELVTQHHTDFVQLTMTTTALVFSFR